jgi:glycosyltransferase involved in cell wall biosynthesis
MSDNKKNILVFSDWFLPGYRAGGPIRSLANLVQNVPHQFYIVTSITDHHSQVPYENIEPNCWVQHSSNVKVMYLDNEHINAATFSKVLDEVHCDKIYFNSLFSPSFTIAPLRIIAKRKLQHKVILAPRGMLKSGALSVKKHKKKLFLLYAKWVGLYKGITWHATNSNEVDEIKNMFGINCRVVLSHNLPTIVHTAPQKHAKEAGQLKLISIARISPEKGILEALHYLKKAQLKGHVIFDMYGVQQNEEYLNLCKNEAESIPHASIHFKGEIDPMHIAGALQEYHFFYMPTWGENFGHAIAEALGNATPVLITNTTPWQQLEENRAGWNLPAQAELFAAKLREMWHMNDDEYRKWSEGAFALGNKTSRNPALIEAAIQLFQ